MNEQSIGILLNAPDDHRKSIEHAISYLCWLCNKTGCLNSGETALYWNLVAVIGQHMAPRLGMPVTLNMNKCLVCGSEEHGNMPCPKLQPYSVAGNIAQ